MDYKRQYVVARQLASILAENEATVSDLPIVFEKVRDNLTVTLKEEDLC